MEEKFDVLNEFGEFTGEVKEELEIDITDDDIKYLVGSSSINIKGDIINKHYNECYLITKVQIKTKTAQILQ